MPNLFQKLENNNVIHTGIIFIPEVIERETYNRLYEWQGKWEWEQNWTNFKNNYKVNFKFLENLEDIDVSKEIICLWFFRDRNDHSKGNDIVLAGKKITDFHNTFLITQFKDIEILENKRQYIHRPFVQIDLNKKTYNEIVKKFK